MPANPRSHQARLILAFFLSLILAKCALAEAASLHYQLDFSSAIYIWAPSLLLSGLFLYLYAAGPGSPFAHATKSLPNLVLWASTWIALALLTANQVPSTLVPIIYLLGVGGLLLTISLRSTHTKFALILGCVWMLFGGLACFLSGSSAYALMGLGFLVIGAIPAGYLYVSSRSLLT